MLICFQHANDRLLYGSICSITAAPNVQPHRAASMTLGSYTCGATFINNVEFRSKKIYLFTEEERTGTKGLAL